MHVDHTLTWEDATNAGLDTTSALAGLDRRENDGIAVSLLWSKSDNRLTVVVCDDRTDETLEIPGAPENALDVFRHPFAYAA